MIYVMSDIHGNSKRFNSIMKQIKLKDTDTLYILGDVIDRYPDGIRILRKIMKMDNVKMLLGNHEHMMLKALRTKSEEDDFLTPYGTSLWYRNGGRVTHNYLKHIRKDLRREVFAYLTTLPINIEIEVNDKKYLLVHGAPERNFRRAHGEYETSKEYAVWHRWKVFEFVPEEYTLIFGHTPTLNFNDVVPLEVFFCDNAIGIDCGCGFEDGRLACVRLDDMKIFYSSEEGETNE